MFDKLVEKQELLIKLATYAGISWTIPIMMLIFAGFLMCRPSSNLGYIDFGKKWTKIYCGVVVFLLLIATGLTYELQQVKKEVTVVREAVIKEAMKTSEYVTKDEIIHYHDVEDTNCFGPLIEGKTCIKVYFEREDDSIAVAYTPKSNATSLTNEEDEVFKVIEITPALLEKFNDKQKTNELDNYFDIDKYFYLD